MRVWTAAYALSSKQALGAKARSTLRRGVLLKIEDEGAIGYADLHPWPELGDEPLEKQLALLRDGGRTALLDRALEIAALDRGGRAHGKSLFENMQVPDSHFLVGDVATIDEECLRTAWGENFRTIKLKVGRAPLREIDHLLRFEKDLSSFNLRFDCNAVLTMAEAKSWLSALPVSIRERIEFVEDPCAWQEGEWRKLHEETGCPLALDRAGNAVAANAFQWLVLKPAVQDPAIADQTEARVCVTSYLDHPLGQVAAAYVAAKLGGSARAGLNSHRVYEKNEFSEQLNWRGPQFTIPDGTGLGFDRLLEIQDWQRL